MAQDSFVLFVEGVHGRPGECDSCQELARIVGQIGVSPRRSGCVSFTRANVIPGRRPEVAVPVGMLAEMQGAGKNVGLWEVGNRIAIRLEQHKDLLAIGDPRSAETHAHASANWFGIQEPLWQWFGNEESADRSG